MQQIEPSKQYTEQKKPDIEEYILYDSIYEKTKGKQMYNRNQNSCCLWVSVCWQGDGNIGLKWHKGISRGHEKGWGNSYTAIYICANLLSWTLNICAFYCVWNLPQRTV